MTEILHFVQNDRRRVQNDKHGISLIATQSPRGEGGVRGIARSDLFVDRRFSFEYFTPNLKLSLLNYLENLTVSPTLMPLVENQPFLISKA